MHVEVIGTDFIRDIESKAIINTDNNAKNEYYNKVRILTSQKQELNTVRSEIDNIKNDISEIKHLMFELLNKG